MSKMKELPADAPAWVTKDRQINELIYCCSFLSAHPMKCIHGKFFTVDGLVPDEGSLKQMIFDDISEWKENGVARKVEDLLKSIKMMAYAEDIPLHYDRIHVANGTWHLDGSFCEEKEYCRNRLDVGYNPSANVPKLWLSFLDGLLEAEDIPTLQEYLGYCLLPSTKAQKMLMLIGKGGEGKSRIGLVMRSIFGISMNMTSIQKIETNRFSRADLEDKLLMVDDDMDMSALPKTNYIKSIVTSECKMDVERKGIQSYQCLLYTRFLCFGNGALTALHDRSDGFFRRQIVLTTKDRPADRVDDPFLVEKMICEKEGIFLWCLEGLKRLISNNYYFTISQRAKDNIAAAVKDANNIIDFFASDGYLSFNEDSKTSTKSLYGAYKEWCEDNADNPLSMKSFANYVSQNADTYHLTPDNNIYLNKGKRCRGYKGVEVIDHDNPFL
ncbi:MAG: phage/plasmid primase, P4 family [Oribacterium sp.]|nr:phage/plasmid primase, P4 family [Oribacterium sp.]